ERRARLLLQLPLRQRSVLSVSWPPDPFLRDAPGLRRTAGPSVPARGAARSWRLARSSAAVAPWRRELRFRLLPGLESGFRFSAWLREADSGFDVRNPPALQSPPL